MNMMEGKQFDWPAVERERASRLARIEPSVGRLPAHRERVVDVAVAETKLPRKHLFGEFDAAVEAVSNLDELHRQDDEQLSNLRDSFGFVYRRVKKGKVVVFTPWNTPILSLVFLPLVSYTTGNRTVVKPSSRVHELAEVIADLYRELPIEFEYADGRVVSERLASSNADFVYYMGSQAIGESIESSFDGEFFGEYEANNVAIVDTRDSSYPELVVENVVEKNGMDCDNLRGVFVREELSEWFLREVRAAFDELVVGDPADPATDLSEYYEPSGDPIIVDPDLSAVSEPTMEPTLWVSTYADREELRSNLSRFFAVSGYGLSTVVLSGDRIDSLLTFLATETPTARICLNKQSLEFLPHAPWGGRGATADGGVSTWIEKFTDLVVIESANGEELR